MTNTTAIQEFDFGVHAVRVQMDGEGNPWWVASDVCEALGISNTSQVINRLHSDEKGICSTYTLGGQQELLAINEPGLYRIIFSSRKKAAEKFQRWVFHEVLPAIRQTGTYTHKGVDTDDALPTMLEQRLSALEQRLDGQALLAPRQPVEHDIATIRTRFAGALNDAIRLTGVTRNMTRSESATYHAGINTRLKGVMAGRNRENWELKHYILAADYLKLIHEMHLHWIFQVTEVYS